MEGVVRGDRRITLQELEAARQTVRLCSGLSRLELARTICEHWGWVTASGSYKVTACLKVLEEWEDRGLLRLPGKRPMTRWQTDRACGAALTPRTNPAAPLVGELSQAGSVWLALAKTTGRGLARAGQVYQSTPKLIYVKALAEDFRPQLCGGPLPRRVEP